MSIGREPDYERLVGDMDTRLSVRIARMEETLYGDGKANLGLVADVKLIADTIIGQKWRDYALILIIILLCVELFLIALLFVRVY